MERAGDEAEGQGLPRPSIRCDAVFQAKRALDKAEAADLRDRQPSPINDGTKKSYMAEQLEIGKLIYDLEEEALSP